MQWSYAVEGTGAGLPASPPHTSAAARVDTGQEDGARALREHPGSARHHADKRHLPKRPWNRSSRLWTRKKKPFPPPTLLCKECSNGNGMTCRN